MYCSPPLFTVFWLWYSLLPFWIIPLWKMIYKYPIYRWKFNRSLFTGILTNFCLYCHHCPVHNDNSIALNVHSTNLWPKMSLFRMLFGRTPFLFSKAAAVISTLEIMTLPAMVLTVLEYWRWIASRGAAIKFNQNSDLSL